VSGPEPPDARRPPAPIRWIDELVWRLRRDGFQVTSTQAIDLARMIELVGVRDGAAIRRGAAAIVVDRANDRARFEEAFDSFFGLARGGTGDLLDERLAAEGLTPAEIRTAREALQRAPVGGEEASDRLLALLDRGAALDRLLWLAGASTALEPSGERQLGFRTHQLLRHLGVERAREQLESARPQLEASLGSRSAAVSEALTRELERSHEALRAHLAGRDLRRAPPGGSGGAGRPAQKPFASLSPEEFDEVRGLVRGFATRLRGGARVRARRLKRGTALDAAATSRRALRTGGAPFHVVRKRLPDRRHRLVVLYDVSDSVRTAARFFLEFAYVAQELFEDTRSFAFVSDLLETTDLFDRRPASEAVERAWAAAAGLAGHDSNYRHVFKRFEQHHLREIDRRTTVVVLGDGRSSYGHAPAATIDRLRKRARSLVWLCPEPRARWTEGDSAMAVYAPRCSAVYEVVCADELEEAARGLVQTS
jgi:uncharacterized protein with von Willebrand factor type A (vWA) domain